MKNKSWYLGAIVALAPLAGNADPIVSGSDYNLTLTGEGGQTTNTLTFDGVAETFLRNGETVTVNESQTDIDGWNASIGVDITSTGDLFPDTLPGSRNYFVNIGFNGNPFDLTQTYLLKSIVMTFFDAAGAVFASADFIGFISDPSNWDGTFTENARAGGFVGGGGSGIYAIRLDFQVAKVPEPSTLALLGLGLFGIGAARRRRGTQSV